VTVRILGADEAPPSDRPPTYANGALWSAASGRFHPVRLRAAIVARGWTVGEFSAASGVSRACLYNVLRHQAASDRTVIRITQTLAGREPVDVAG
jgi:lambda repressor-like predicted transcriptional regulator